jgi:hypothetical protein
MFERYAVFFTPTGALAAWGSAWLGWDSAEGCCVTQPTVTGVDVAGVTATPRRYGLHATLKAPFRIAQGADLVQLQQAAANFATQHTAFSIGAIELRHDSGFVALRPKSMPKNLKGFAASSVKAFDAFRAPLTDTDIARRRKASLTARQDQQMLDWGYPFTFEDFHFHLTLSGGLPEQQAAIIIAALTPDLDPIVPTPLVIDAITLMG